MRVITRESMSVTCYVRWKLTGELAVPCATLHVVQARYGKERPIAIITDMAMRARPIVIITQVCD